MVRVLADPWSLLLLRVNTASTYEKLCVYSTPSGERMVRMAETEDTLINVGGPDCVH